MIARVNVWTTARHWVSSPKEHLLFTAVARATQTQLCLEGQLTSAPLAQLRGFNVCGVPMVPISTLLDACTAAPSVAWAALEDAPVTLANVALDSQQLTTESVSQGSSTALLVEMECISGRLEVSVVGAATDLSAAHLVAQASQTASPNKATSRQEAPGLSTFAAMSRRSSGVPSPAHLVASVYDLSATDEQTQTIAAQCQLQSTSFGSVRGPDGSLPAQIDCLCRAPASAGPDLHTTQQASRDGSSDCYTATCSGRHVLRGVSWKPVSRQTQSQSIQSSMLRLGWEVSCPESLATPSRTAALPSLVFGTEVCAAIAVLQELHQSENSASAVSRLMHPGAPSAPGGMSAVSLGVAALPGLLRSANLESDGIAARMHDTSAAMPRQNLGQMEAFIQTQSARTLPRQSVDGPNGSISAGEACLLPRMSQPAVANTRAQQSVAQEERVYVVSGGTGVVGGLVARWLVSQGASEVLLLGRSGRAGTLGSIAHEDRAQHTTVLSVASCDVGAAEDSFSFASGLRGSEVWLMHAGGVLADASIGNQTASGLRKVFQPKVSGTLNLQKHTKGLAAGAHVLFSSIASLWGSPGQLQYAAANSVLDRLAASGQSSGLPSISINWGAWSGGGMASAATKSRIERSGIKMVHPSLGLAALGALTAQLGVMPSVAVSPVEWATFLPQIPPTARMMYSDLERDRGETTAEAAGRPEAQAHRAPAALRQSSEAVNEIQQSVDAMQEVRPQTRACLQHSWVFGEFILWFQHLL